MRTGVFLQVRIASKRLHGKALLILEGQPVIQHAMQALIQVRADIHALVTEPLSVIQLQNLARKMGFQVFTGPENDVLRRYCMAAKHFKTDYVIRACGDNPLVSARLAEEILDLHREKHMDLSHFIGIPLGTGVEVITAEALYNFEPTTQDPFEREHITTHMYRHRDKYRVLEEACDERFNSPDANVTLDTHADYEFLKDIFEELYRGKPIEIEALIGWLKVHNDC